jgi:hypothetical protein
MVCALIDGRKFQTRRIVKWRPNECYAAEIMREPDGKFRGYDHAGDVGRPWLFDAPPCPYGSIGDQLWVKETFWTDRRDPNDVVIYAATPSQHKYRLRGFVETESEITTEYLEKHEFWNRRPSIFMWRWASRLTLEIKAVRIERLNDISAEDARKEGLKKLTKDDGLTWKYGIPDRDGLPGNDDHGWTWREWCVNPIDAYKTLWESINGEGSWAENPWVWVVEFRLQKP